MESRGHTQGTRERPHLPQPVVVAQLEVKWGGPLPPPTQELFPPPHILLGQVETVELGLAGGFPVAIYPCKAKVAGVLSVKAQWTQELLGVAEGEAHLG